MNYREAIAKIKDAVVDLYGLREAEQMARIVVEEISGASRTEIILNPDKELITSKLDSIVDDLSKGRPLQYVLGRAEFCDLEFEVREGVLIPRPESEELVRWIVADSSEGARILDVGTGSGCIAISLKSAMVKSNVEAIDISSDALVIAEANGLRLGVDVNFGLGDALNGLDTIFDGYFDVIVSNPPYIPLSDMESMRINVTDYEPHIALFVESDDPLIFYRSIARAATKMLVQGGKLYFEIYEEFADQMEAMLKNEGFYNIVLRTDINDKPRMICSQKR